MCVAAERTDMFGKIDAIIKEVYFVEIIKQHLKTSARFNSVMQFENQFDQIFKTKKTQHFFFIMLTFTKKNKLW